VSNEPTDGAAEAVGAAGGPPRSFEGLKALIAHEYDGFSKRLKQIADHALANPNAMAFQTAADLARDCGTAPSALIRFAKTLGYSGFSELQTVFRDRLSEMAPSYRDRIRHLHDEATEEGASSLLTRFSDATIEALRHLRDGDSGAQLEEAARLLASARMVHVVANRRTFPAAFYLAYNFNRLEVPANLLDGVGGTMGTQVNLIAPDDVLVAISFQPNAPETLVAFDHALAVGARVISITDSVRAPFTQSDILFEVTEATVTGFRSINVTMFLALILALRTGQIREAGTSLS
jgi:DNA-binding MurR/RpiR family transcriptional regulator